MEEVILNPTELKFLLIDSLEAYSEDVLYVSGNNPYFFKVNRKPVYMFIHNVHDSGQGRTNEDECRIQFAKTDNFQDAINSREPVLFLGYHSRTNTFTAWDSFIQTDRINSRQTVSVYSRFSTLEQASKDGIAVYVDNNGQKIISFRLEFLGLYLENFDEIHDSNKETLSELIKQSNEKMDAGEEVRTEISRQKFTITHRKFKRSQQFTINVNKAYSHRCAFCGIQLELVEAAHIIPHAHEKGSDEFTNGICLCALHHMAFDKGIIYLTPEYEIKINESKIEYLTKIGKDGGSQKFIGLHFDKINLPSSILYHPSIEFIGIANRIRGIVDSNE